MKTKTRTDRSYYPDSIFPRTSSQVCSVPRMARAGGKYGRLVPFFFILYYISFKFYVCNPSAYERPEMSQHIYSI